MKIIQPEVTIQPDVVESQLVPKWAQVGESVSGTISTHISSQEDLWVVDEENIIDDGKKPPYFVRRMTNNRNATTIIVEQETFTCKECPQQIKSGWYSCGCCGDHMTQFSTERCAPCNTKYKRWQRVKRAFRWLGNLCHEHKCRPKFLTITKTLRKSPIPFTEEMIEADRKIMMKEFKLTRKTKAWPNKYGGIWVYEAKVRAPGDEVYERWPDEKTGKRKLLHTATQFELHGHIHCALATRWINRDPLLERHEGIHVKASGIKHMKKYLLGYMLVDTVGRYNRIGGEKTWEK